MGWSVFGRLLYVVDEEIVNRGLIRFKLKPELLLDVPED